MNEEDFIHDFRLRHKVSEARAKEMYRTVLEHIKDNVNPKTLTQTTLDWWLGKRIEELSTDGD